MQMNLWADGGAWSGEPSRTDVIMNIRSIVMFYNTTASDAGGDREFDRRCRDAGGVNDFAVCTDADSRVEDDRSVAASRPASGLMVGFAVSVLVMVMLLA